MNRIGEEAGWGSKLGSWGGSAGGVGPTVLRIAELDTSELLTLG